MPGSACSGRRASRPTSRLGCTRRPSPRSGPTPSSGVSRTTARRPPRCRRRRSPGSSRRTSRAGPRSYASRGRRWSRPVAGPARRLLGRQTVSDQTFDYVIVGAGTAGCLLANRLSADPSRRVLLLEAGRKDNYHWIHIPVGYLYCIGNPRTDWLYQTEPEAGLNGRQLRYPRGKALGGCSSINGMIYMRGQARDYDNWAALTGDDAWRWDNVLPSFKQHEDHHRGPSEFH